MPINTTQVLRHIERRLGTSFHTLELSQDEIIETVIQETLPTFSKYFPYMHRISIDIHEDQVPGRIGVYYLKSDLEIIGMAKLYIDNVEAQQNNISSYYMDPVDQQIRANMESLVFNPVTWHYEAPNILEVFPKTFIVRNAMAEVKTIHGNHMTTIPMNLRDEFLELAYYDVCISLLPIRQHFSQINTSFGSIELFMNRLEEASDKRKDLLELFRVNAAKSANRKKLFIY